MPNHKSSLAGLSERNGPVQQDEMDINGHSRNGVHKRKSRPSIPSYAESDSDDEPIVSDDFSKDSVALKVFLLTRD